MKDFAAIFVSFILLAASLQAQQIYPFADDGYYGIPIIDPKLKLLINDVDMANFRAVDYHNKKFVKKANESLELKPDWVTEHTLLVAKWTAWDSEWPLWGRKKLVEASATIVPSGGIAIVGVRSIGSMQVQKKTLLVWESVTNQILELTESKELWEGLDDLREIWSEFQDRVGKLDKAIDALRAY